MQRTLAVGIGVVAALLKEAIQGPPPTHSAMPVHVPPSEVEAAEADSAAHARASVAKCEANV